jgi:hypothetical protein
VSPGAKKVIVVLVVLLVIYFVYNDPTGSGALVQNLLNILRQAAESVITFFRSLLGR